MYKVTLHRIEKQWNLQPHHCKIFVTQTEKSTTLSNIQSSNSPQIRVTFLHKSRQFMLTINSEQLINFMEQNTWEIYSSSANEFLCILWNPKVNYHVDHSPTLAPILCQINPVYISILCLENPFNIILSYMPRFSKWSHPSGFSPPKPRMHISSPPYVPCAQPF
jgi:hypothetical protein